MASLQRHRVKGHTYWRIVESRRVNGKPRAIPIMHLGTADQLLERLLNAPRGQLRVQSFQHGDVAALKAAADRLDVVNIIDKHVTKRRRGLSVGNTMLLAAINRAVRPRSKMGWADWARKTSLHRLFPGLKVEKLTSQFFWDQMDSVELSALNAIEDDLTRAVVRELDVQLDTLFYDTTNFFTYIDQIVFFSATDGISMKKTPSNLSARLNSGGSLEMSLQVPMKNTSFWWSDNHVSNDPNNLAETPESGDDDRVRIVFHFIIRSRLPGSGEAAVYGLDCNEQEWRQNHRQRYGHDDSIALVRSQRLHRDRDPQQHERELAALSKGRGITA